MLVGGRENLARLAVRMLVRSATACASKHFMSALTVMRSRKTRIRYDTRQQAL
jgi:hypothetical protein